MVKLRKPRKIGKRVVKSEFEYDIYSELRDLIPKGSKLEYESETFEYTLTKSYLPDFKISKKNGSSIYIEAKGNGRAFDGDVRAKMLAIKQQYPDLDLRIVFYSDGKIGPKRKDGSFRKQSDWATQHGFVFAIKHIPEAWFKE